MNHEVERYAWRIAYGRESRVAHLVRKGSTLCATRFDERRSVWRDPVALGWTVPRCRRCEQRKVLAEKWIEKLEKRHA